MVKPLVLLCVAVSIPGAANAVSTIVQTTSATSAAHNSQAGSIDQYDGPIQGVQIDVSGGASAEGYDPFGIGGTAFGVVTGYFLSGSNSLSFSGPVTSGGASCLADYCQASFESSFSRSFTGTEIALFRGTGTVTYADGSYILTSFPTGYPSGHSTVTVTYFLGAPEPVAWMMMVAGFGMVGAALRQRRRVRPAFPGFCVDQALQSFRAQTP